MIWVFVILLAAAIFIALAWWLKLPRSGWELVGAALLLGLAGYALQGSPGQAGSPTAARETRETAQAALIEARKAMGNQFSDGRNYLITADAMARQGQFAAAATLLRGGLKKAPNDADMWVALGNALIGHAGGMITPAAIYAFQTAADIAPDHPGPPFFTGLALAQSGRFTEARAIWQELLDRPIDPEAQWRRDLQSRIERLDGLIAMQSGAAAAAPSGPVPVEQPGDAP